MHVCLRVYACVCAYVHACAHVHLERPEVTAQCPPLQLFCALFFEARSLLEPRAHQFSQPGEPVDSSAVMPGFCLDAGIQTQTLMAGLPIKCLISVFVLTGADIVR